MDMDPPPKDTHFEHSKVNSILYTCPFGRLVDGILLDRPLPCILRLESYTCIMEEVGRKRTTTPSTREAWKRRRKREEAAPNFGRLTTFGRPTCIGIPTAQDRMALPATDFRQASVVRRLGRPKLDGRPTF